ncbi:MAG TPA: hypothetical protein VFW86_06470, partial [Candidatus Limnocylindrales bacterium]|nr:hypothetical protein [Candidatus Limnocylindrales bacterium]
MTEFEARSEGSESNGTGKVMLSGTTSDKQADVRSGAGVQPNLLSELARAMHDTVEQQHGRLIGALDERTRAAIEAVRAAGDEEATDLRARADADLDGIAAWSKTEIERIHQETEERRTARKHGLEEELARHAAIVERQVGAVDAAVAQHRGSLEAYFGRLTEERDPAEIARLAGSVPREPRLDAVAAAARSQAEAALKPSESEPAVAHVPPASSPAQPGEDDVTISTRRLMGVMDPTVAEPAVGGRMPWTARLGAAAQSAQDATTQDAAAVDIPLAPIIQPETEAPVAASPVEASMAETSDAG